MGRQRYLEETVGSYLNKLASAEPEPGGGSAAALVGALGAALITMVTNLTLGKEKYAAVQDDIAQIKASAEEFRGELQGLVTLDAMAYRKVAEAMKLPQESEVQTEDRRRTLQAALKEAAEVPLKIAEAAVKVSQLCLPAAEKGNPLAISDAGAAIVMAHAAAQSAALNVRINLAWIEDEDFKRDIWARVEAVLSESARLYDIVMAMIYSKI